MHQMGHDELAHAQWKSRRLHTVVSLSFGIRETNCSQGKQPVLSYFIFISNKCIQLGKVRENELVVVVP